MVIQNSVVDTKPELKWLKLNDLMIPIRYQRALEGDRSLSMIQHIQKNFNWAEFGTLLVCKIKPSDTKFGVIDGQHRFRGAELRDDVSDVPCVVISPREINKQAETFININSRRVPLNAFQLHRAAVVAEDPVALEVERICKETDVVIPLFPMLSHDAEPNVFQSVGKLRTLIMSEDYNPELVIWSLKTLRTAFPKRKGALRSNLFRSLVDFIKKYPEVKMNEIVKTLQALNINETDLEARRLQMEGHGAMWKGYLTILEKAHGVFKKPGKAA